MNKNLLTYGSLIIILVFIGYMVYDTVRVVKAPVDNSYSVTDDIKIGDSWEISDEISIGDGNLNAVATGTDGGIFFAGGESFVRSYKNDGIINWNIVTTAPVTALAVINDTVFASILDHILVIVNGKIVNEWGPYDPECIITSLSATKSRLAFTDAGNKKVYILDKSGVVKVVVGNSDPAFVIPSPYFDVALNDDNSFWVANTGHRRIEKRSADGMLEMQFGEPGLAPEAFSGCCNPAHFIKFPGGFITTEKGANRIKILDNSGEFVEFVSSKNDFKPSVPLDVATADGNIIYAANPADNKIYVFRRKAGAGY